MNPLWHGTSGPPGARIVLVGESWGQDELLEQRPFVGQSGQELDKMLSEAGLNRDEILCTNVVNKKPFKNEIGRLLVPYDKKAPSYRGLNLTPEFHAEVQRLYAQIEAYPRDLVICAGNYALWALTDRCNYGTKIYDGHGSVHEPTGITSWRASQLFSDTLPTQVRVLPIIHPAAILREWSWRQTTVQDLRRAHLISDWEPPELPTIQVPKSVAELRSWLASLGASKDNPTRLTCDIETYKKLITVVGFGHGGFDENGKALVIPLVLAKGNGEIESWWSVGEEAEIFAILRSTLTDPKYLIEGQNFLYDTQYFIKWLGVCPRLDFDSMKAQNLLFPGTPKDLGYLSSLYCKYHRYWKEDGKEWAATGDQWEHLIYNGEDCLRTFEVITTQRRLIKELGLEEQWNWSKQKAEMALELMLRGIRIDLEHRNKLRRELFIEQLRIHSRLAKLVPKEIVPTPKSSKKPWWESEYQQKDLFYEVMGLKAKTNRKTKRPTINDEALNELEQEYPELSTIFQHLKAERSLGVFRSTFLEAEVDPDGRMRSSFGETETFRWTSSANVFGSGTNLQNIPSGDEE